MKLKLWVIMLCALVIPCLLQAGPGKGKSNSLPPGLQKKVNRGGQLPPGWQKKIAVGKVLDNNVYVHGKVVVPIGKDGSITIDVDGRLLKLHEPTLKILEILK